MRHVSLLLCASVFLATAPAVAAEGPFADFAGSWSGSGSVSVKDGTRERLRCKATYVVSAGGFGLEQNLTCASDSYKFNVVSNIVARDGAISGNWSETSRGASGQIVGRVDPRQITATVEGVGFTAGIGIASRGGKQSVEIRPTGTDITNVNVTMSKL